MFNINGKIEKDILEIFKKESSEKDFIDIEGKGKVLSLDYILYREICEYIHRLLLPSSISLEDSGVSITPIKSGELTLE